MRSACVIGAGPNGLAAAITLARAGVSTTVLERNSWAGGACSTREVTLPGFRHDLGSSAYPMGVASPFFRTLTQPIDWIEPDAPCAHPLDDGTAVMLEHSIEATAAGLDQADRKSYEKLLRPLAEQFDALAEDILGPIVHVPRHPLLLARFGLSALLPAATLAKTQFSGPRAQALFAGMAAHSVLGLEEVSSAAVGLVLLAAGHASGWPVVRGGGQELTNALVKELEGLGGRVELEQEVTHLHGDGKHWTVQSQHGGEAGSASGLDMVLGDVTPRQLVGLAGDAWPTQYRRALERYRYGAAAFKIDYALSEPIPWTARDCGRAATVHLGGTLAEFVESERNLRSERPFCLLVQPSLFDATRAPAGKHTGWVYCHVPNGWTGDCQEKIERQIERFAPGFRDCVLARKVWTPSALETWNANLLGGDISGGAMDVSQLVFRPTMREYFTPAKGLYLCGASTAPGGGVHGMCGWNAAKRALRAQIDAAELTGTK